MQSGFSRHVYRCDGPADRKDNGFPAAAVPAVHGRNVSAGAGCRNDNGGCGCRRHGYVARLFPSVCRVRHGGKTSACPH